MDVDVNVYLYINYLNVCNFEFNLEFILYFFFKMKKMLVNVEIFFKY